MIEEVLVVISVAIGVSAIAAATYFREKLGDRAATVIFLLSLTSIVVFPAAATTVSLLLKHAELSLLPSVITVICGLVTVILRGKD